MAKSSARAKKVGRKAGRGSKVRKPKAKVKPKAALKTRARGTTTVKRKKKPAAKPPKAKRRVRKAVKAKVTPSVGTRKRVPAMRATAAPERPPRLLRDSKSTASALSLLEKAIRLIYYKDFRRARAELNALIENYPAEMEIVARARSYRQICAREEATPRKPAASNDQVYTLGIVEHNRGNYDAAIARFRQMLAKSPDADYIYYSIAASLALKGETGQALENLRKAVGLNEANRVYARNDADFNSLHENREFADLVGMVVQARVEPSL